MKLYHFVLIALTVATLPGCVNVEPAERSYLAQDNMKLDPHYLDAKFARHMYFAREAIPGGYGADPTGCGCN
jgi:hypothetical protein